eukprot:1141576-Amphidinium_carterae.2
MVGGVSLVLEYRLQLAFRSKGAAGCEKIPQLEHQPSCVSGFVRVSEVSPGVLRMCGYIWSLPSNKVFIKQVARDKVCNYCLFHTTRLY